MSYTHITHEDRVALATLLRAGSTQKKIAEDLNKTPGAISKEIGRNIDEDGAYRVRSAERKVKSRRVLANQRFRKIENDIELEDYIVSHLRKYWSPEQIAGRWRKESGTIYHETIYTWVYTERKDLVKYLRCQKGKYRRRRGTKIREKQRELLKKKRIDTRPAVVETRERLGDWEGDTIVGGEKTQRILTHVDRKSGYLLADKLDTVTAEIVQETVSRRMKRVSKDKRKTITYDNGSEFADHNRIERKTKMDVYFAFAYHSWERGTNENTNGLIRQFFPKGSYFGSITDKDVARVERLINNRPRKRLGYATPREIFNGLPLD
jgi:transposase, IS30 family